MKNLTEKEVRVLAKASGLQVSGKDLTEVTHRLNVLINKSDDISYDGLEKIDPASLFLEEREFINNE